MFAAPAGAAVACASAGDFPNTFAAQSGLKVACSSAAGDNVTGISVHDSPNVDWHHGTARTFTMTGAIAAGTTTTPDKTLLFTGTQFTAGDVSRPVSGFDGSNAEVFPGGAFVTAVDTGTHIVTLSQGATTTVTGPITTTVEYTHNRWLTDAFCHSTNPGNVIVRDLDTIAAGPAMTPTGASATNAMSAYPGVTTFTVTPVTVQIPTAGQILINTTGTDGVLHYTAFNGTTFTIDALVSGSGTPAGGASTTWKSSIASEFGNGAKIFKNLSPKLPTVTAGSPGNVTVATTSPVGQQVYTYSGSTSSPNFQVTGVNDPAGSGTISPGAVFNWTLAKASVVSTLTLAPANANNGVEAASAFTSPAVLEDSAGISDGTIAWTGLTGNTFTGVTITGTGVTSGPPAGGATLKQGYKITEGSTASTKLNSASAGFTAADIGKSVSGGPFAAGVYILSIDSLTQAQVAIQGGGAPIQADCTKTNGGNLQSANILVPQDSSSAGTDNIEIGSDTYDIAGANAPELFPGVDPMNVELNNSVTPNPSAFTCSGSVLTLTAAGKDDYAGITGNAITGDEVGLPVSVTGVSGPAVTGTVTAASTAGNGSVTMSVACPAAGVTATGATFAHAYIGGPSAGGAGEGDATMTLAAELNLTPSLVPAQDDCNPAGAAGQTTDTYEGFEVVGSWVPPGASYTTSAVAPIVTTAQILFPTSVLNFNAYIQPQAGGADGSQGGRAHYNLAFSSLPTSLAVCLNDTVANGGTPWNGTELAFGMNATTLSHAPFLPTGSGNTGDPTVRRLLPVTTADASVQGFGATFHQIVSLTNGGVNITGSPATGPNCTILGPTATPADGAGNCGDG